MLLDVPKRLTAATLAVALLVSACSGGGGAPPPGFGTGPSGLGRVYRLGIGDKLKIVVFGEENLSGPTEVNAFGNVSLPLIGEVPAKGQSLDEFRASVTRRYGDGFIKNPKITVEITNYRPIYVHGEVKSGGEFAFKNGLKLRDAIAMAGGYTYRADESFVTIVREEAEPARLALPADLDVLPGDNIRVPERFF
jgi:polysaccharide export outer membrane protein